MVFDIITSYALLKILSYMGFKPQLSIFLNDKKCLKHIHTAYEVVLNDVYRQNKTTLKV